MSRDWQKDMELVEKFKYSQTLCNGIQPTFHGMISMPEPVEIALEYWLQQYAAEKERADKAEAREKELREALKNVRTITRGSTAYTEAAYAHREAHKTLASLYPKEGDTK